MKDKVEAFIDRWRLTGGSEIANTQSFINGLCDLIGVEAPHGSKANAAHNEYVYEHGVFQENGDGSTSFGRIDCYKRGCFILEAKQGSDADREAAGKGEDDLDLFGQTAATRVKRGTARRGTGGWVRAMIQAKGQAERYAKALPVEDGWPPILMVADIGYCIEVYADFTGSGKAYAQFPDRSRYRVMLDDLRDPEVRDRLAAIWTDPKSLNPSAKSARVTREIAELLAKVAKRIERRGHDPEQASSFLMRLLFTMFAEDSNLIPEGSFTKLLKEQRDHPEHLANQLSALWQAMDKGGFAPALGVPVKMFNGYLFKDTSALPLDREELEVLIQAAQHMWQHVEPAIFGTLLERALNPKERSKLGAHYTPRAYVERLIGPTIMEPLRAEWDGVRAAAAQLIEEDKVMEAKRGVETFHGRLAQTKVLDPACGTGNFLYVAMARMKELEGEVLDLLVELGDDQYVAEITGHTITPENFLGIEINPRAAAIAQLVLWIGYLQWHFRVNGVDRAPPEPILRDIRTIENRDALIAYDKRELERDEHGNPLSIWDGTSYKEHPITGKLVPDETGRLEVYRYWKPRETTWPRADFIVGNPPFIGNKRMRQRLGDGYVEAVRKAQPKVSDAVDFVMHWWAKAASLVGKGGCRRFGFITSNSISQTFNRSVIENAKCDLAFAIPDHPWVDANDGAAVRIAMTVGTTGPVSAVLMTVRSETTVDDASGEVTVHFDEQSANSINPDLSVGLNIRDCKPLKANSRMAFTGMYPLGDGFILPADDTLMNDENVRQSRHLKRFFTASDLTRKPRDCQIIDFYPLAEADAREASPVLYQHLLLHVKPSRAVNPVEERRRNWWLFTRPIPDLRDALDDLTRFIAIPRTAKYFTFQFIDATAIVDTTVVAVAHDDAFVLGILSSEIHKVWALRAGGTLEDRPRYQHESTFKPFPFPADVPELLKDRTRAEAEALDALRKRVLAEHEDLTLTKLYNVLEALREGRVLTEAERDMHDRGLVTVIRQHHDRIDALVAEAYGWPANLPDEDILARLVALNRERAAEEAKGLVRWLRPAFQAPDHVGRVTETLDLGEAAAVIDDVLPWPESLPERVSAVQAVLATAGSPLDAHSVARAFKGKRAATVRPVLDALAGIGKARRLEDGRYAA